MPNKRLSFIPLLIKKRKRMESGFVVCNFKEMFYSFTRVHREKQDFEEKRFKISNALAESIILLKAFDSMPSIQAF